MANTRFSNDDARILKRLEMSTGPGRYMLNVPGNGDRPEYMEDPHIVLQKWGANRWSHAIDIDTALRRGGNALGDIASHASPIQYPDNKGQLSTDQSRATHPAFMYRNLPINHNAVLLWDPQQFAMTPFPTNVASRIIEKDRFTIKRDTFFHNHSR